MLVNPNKIRTTSLIVCLSCTLGLNSERIDELVFMCDSMMSLFSSVRDTEKLGLKAQER